MLDFVLREGLLFYIAAFGTIFKIRKIPRDCCKR